MIDPLTGCLKITQYNNKRVISIANLVETTWMSRYPRPMEIMYDQGKQFIGNEFRKPLIEMEYGITAKPSTSGNITSNKILEHIHQVLVNLVRICNITQTYIEEDDPWLGILDTEDFAIISTIIC